MTDEEPKGGTGTLSPAAITALTLVGIVLGIGPTSGPTSPNGAIFDSAFYPGETDGDMLDFSDCRAHLFNADLTDQHWNWAISNGGQDTQYAASPDFDEHGASKGTHPAMITPGCACRAR